MKITINILWLVIPGIIGLGLFLQSDHREHLLDFLPVLILPACPMMHLLMHHRSGTGHHDRSLS